MKLLTSWKCFNLRARLVAAIGLVAITISDALL